MKGNIVLAVTLLFAVITFQSGAQDQAIVKDLHNEWKVYDDGKYVPFRQSGKVTTIYFVVEATAFSGMHLLVSSPSSFTLFINGQLAAKASAPLSLNIDSLSDHFQSPLLQVAVHQREIHDGGLQTAVISKTGGSAFGEMLAPHYSSFRDFAVVGILVLLMMLITITKLNPKLASDYFSVVKIFSMREGEDGQSRSRITSSINILFYAYSSLMLGYFLMIIYHFLPHEYPTALFFQATTFWDAVVQWAELSSIVLALFFPRS